MTGALKVKICGITRKEDALAAAEAGADALGFIFAASSPRYIGLERAKEIISALPPFVTPVGVFVDSPRRDVEHAIAITGIRCLQLHGEESPEDTQGFGLPVIKAFHVHPQFDPASMSRYTVSAFLLDTYSQTRQGGTGKVFDWDLARRAASSGRIILSGGLRPSNVVDAVSKVKPYAIDVNSGVELSPGVKNHQELIRLFDAVRPYHVYPQQELLC